MNARAGQNQGGVGGDDASIEFNNGTDAEKAPEASHKQEILASSDRAAAEKISLPIRESKTHERIQEKEREERVEDLEEGFETQRQSVSAIELNKDRETQPAVEDLLEPAIERAFTRLFDADITFAGWEYLPATSASLTARAKLGTVELIALEKAREMARNPQSRLAQEEGPYLEKIFQRARTSQETARDILQKGPWYIKAIEYAKENPVRTVAFVAAGALGIWGAYKLATRENEPGAQTKGVIATLTGGLLALGAILNPGEWPQWIEENFGYKLSLKNLFAFVKGGFNLDALKEGLIHIDDLSKKAATYLKVEPDKVAALRDMKYEDFNNTKNGTETLVYNAVHHLAETLGLQSPAPQAVFDQTDHREEVAAASALLDLFNSPKGARLISGKNPSTVGEALAILDQGGAFSAPAEAAPSERGTPTEVTDDPEAALDTEPQELFGEGEDQIGISQESWNELESALEEKSHTREMLDSFEGVTSWLNPVKLWGLAKAVKEDGMTLIQDDKEGLILWTGAEYILLSPLKTVGATFKEAVAAGIEEETTWKDALKVYIDQGGGLIILYGTIIGAPSIIHGLIEIQSGKVGSGLMRMGKGLVRSIAAPADILAKQISVGVAVGDAGADLKRWGQEQGYRAMLLKEGGSPEMKARRNAIRMDRLKFYADQYKRFDERYRAAFEDKGFISQREGISTPEHLQRRAAGAIRSARVRSLREKYAKKFQIEYDRMLESKAFGSEFKGGAIKEHGAGSSEFADGLRYFEEAYEQHLTERITTRTQEIRELRRRAGGWDRFSNTEVRQMLIERGIDPNSPQAQTYTESWERFMAEQEVRGQKFDPHGLHTVEGIEVKARVQKVGENKFRYQGIDFEIPPDEMSRLRASAASSGELGTLNLAREYCAREFRIPAIQGLEVERGVALENGMREYEVNRRRIEATNLEDAKARYLDVLEREGKPIPNDFAARIRYHMSWVPAAEAILGTAGVAYIIYDLETAEDKQEACVKTLSILGAAIGGSWAFEKSIGKISTNPYFHLFGNIAAGMIAVTLGEEKVEEVLGYVFKQIPGIDDASPHIAHLIELQTAQKFAVKPILSSAPRLASKMGFQKLERFLLRKVESRVLVQVERIAAKTGLKSGLKMLGWRGAAAGIMFADDATVIGVVDDVVAVGLLAWSAADIIEIVGVVKNAKIIKDEMEKRKEAPIEKIEMSGEYLTRLKDKLKEMGYLEKELYAEGGINPEVLNALPEEELFALLDGSDFTIYRAGGREEWKLRGGEPAYLGIYERNNLIASITDEEIDKIDKKIDEYESATTQQSDEKLVENFNETIHHREKEPQIKKAA